MNAYETCRTYLALKLHFTSKYDYFKYNGKVSITPDAFDKRKDKYKFLGLSKRYSDQEIVDYFVANFIRGNNWVGTFTKECLLDHQKQFQSLDYIYKNDLENLLTTDDSFDILFECGQGTHPRLLRQYLGKKVCLETMVILEKILQYRARWDKEISETYLWPSVSTLIENYTPFIKIDTREYRMKTLTIAKEFV